MKKKTLLFFPLFLSSLLLFGQEFSTSTSAISRSDGCATGEEDVASSNEAYEYEVLAILNQIRLEFDLQPLKLDNDVRRAARYHANDMSVDDYFKHDSHDRDANGELVLACDTWERVPQFYSYHGAAENIAAGYPTPRAVMDGWMNSDGHRKNILNERLKTVGIGYVENSEGRPYWVQNFGGLNNEFHVLINNDAPDTDNLSVDIYIQGDWSSMRLSNNAQNWTNWSTFQNAITWNLEEDNFSQKKVYVEVKNTEDQVIALEDEIFFAGVTTSTNDIAIAPIELYPNPVSDGFLTVTLPNEKFSKVYITGYLGSVITDLPTERSQQIISTNNFSNGPYLLVAITTNGRVLSIPFLKH